MEFKNGGVDGTLNQATLMGALLEHCQLMNEQESAQSAPNRLNMTDSDSGVRSVTFTNPIVKVQSGEGVLYVSEDYLPGFIFNPGTGGDLSATTLPGAFIQLVELISSTDAGASRVTANSINTAGTQSISLTINTVTSRHPTTGILETVAVDDV